MLKWSVYSPNICSIWLNKTDKSVGEFLSRLYVWYSNGGKRKGEREREKNERQRTTAAAAAAWQIMQLCLLFLSSRLRYVSAVGYWRFIGLSAGLLLTSHFSPFFFTALSYLWPEVEDGVGNAPKHLFVFSLFRSFNRIDRWKQILVPDLHKAQITAPSQKNGVPHWFFRFILRFATSWTLNELSGIIALLTPYSKRVWKQIFSFVDPLSLIFSFFLPPSWLSTCLSFPL